MHHVKIFKGLENDLAGLEAEINRWLDESKVRVVQICGNLAPQTQAAGVQSLASGGLPPSDVLLIVLYEQR